MADDPGPTERQLMPAVLAIDGGSTKTDAVLVAANGTLLGRARVGPSNHQFLGIDGAIEALAEAVADVFADAGVSDAAMPLCEVGVYCLAGIDLPIDENRLAPAIALRGWTGTDLLRNDTFAISRAGTQASWGIGVVCGTGMNCAGTGPDGSTVRFPALAELSGDFAPGGSWLGIRALGLALRAGDGRGKPTLLTERIPVHFEQLSVDDVLLGIYSGTIPYGRVFELAQVLLDTAKEGDTEAQGAAAILADEVVAFVTAAINRLDVSAAPVEVVLGGGVFHTSYEGFHDRVAAGIHRAAPLAVLRRLDAPPVLGAGLLGLDAIGATDEAKSALRTALSSA